jgi:hypothetical protein
LDVFAFVLQGNEHIFRAAFRMATALVIGVRIVVMFVTEFEEMNGL